MNILTLYTSFFSNPARYYFPDQFGGWVGGWMGWNEIKANSVQCNCYCIFELSLTKWRMNLKKLINEKKDVSQAHFYVCTWYMGTSGYIIPVGFSCVWLMYFLESKLLFLQQKFSGETVNVG